ncbi:uncharacterized protein LOC101858791 [Aplysia californica]|uniref:Uncharacterized protein LOC101858791 n=1 Tax=Aplysia californica TaxID=6500 RepID=A0ABM0JVD7_APLCA|nr:uncharacterized protein LOC101858791 [Aplysia californica]
MGSKQTSRDSTAKPGKKGKKAVTEELEPVPEPEPEPEPVITDPYAELRYVPQPPRPQCTYAPKMQDVFVLKRKCLPSISKDKDNTMIKQEASENETKSDAAPREKNKSSKRRISRPRHRDIVSCETMRPIEEIVWTSLSDQAMAPPLLSPWVFPGELPVTPPPLEILHKDNQQAPCFLDKLHSSLFKEQGGLELHDKAQEERLRIENYVISKTGRSRGKLLLRRSQLLPKSETDGLEKSQTTMERMETPDVFPVEAFFKVPIEKSNGLTYTLTKRERGYNVITDWLGCPEVTDEVLKELGTITRSLDPSSAQAKSQKGENGTEDGRNDEKKKNRFVPDIATLGVEGKQYNMAQSEIRALEGRTEAKGDGSGDIIPSEIHVHDGKIAGEVFASEGCKPNVMKAAAPRLSQVSLIFGNHKLFYSTDPERAKKKWVIEIGCSAEVGENAISSVFMQNTGTTVIHFNWVKISHDDPFELHRYDMEHFVFDYWGGTILSGEIFRVPFMYRSIGTGYFSEDWRLLTKPLLENGADIILRMWGVTRQYDPCFLARDRIDEDLQSRMTWNIVDNRLHKIMDYLPLKDSMLKDTRFPLNHRGPDLFHFNNPHLYYNTASVFRLGKLHEMLQLRKSKRQRLRGPPAEEDMTKLDSGEDSDTFISNSSATLPRPEVLKEPGEGEGEDMEASIQEVIEEYNSDLSLTHVTGTQSEIIEHATQVIRRRIDPDIPALKHVPESVSSTNSEAEGDGDEDPQASEKPTRKIPKAPINLVNPDFDVNNMREDILQDDESCEIQEALFSVMATEVDKLYFRNFDAKEDWKRTVCFTLLVQAVDNFSDFAVSLQRACCTAEAISKRQQEEAEAEEARLAAMAAESNESFISETVTEDVATKPKAQTKAEAAPKPATGKEAPATSRQSDVPEGDAEIDPDGEMGEAETPAPTDCLSIQPRHALDPVRFQDQYYGRLQSCMYHLLDDAFGKMDVLFATEKKEPISLRYSETGFTKIRDIPMPVDTDKILRAPLPPPWVKVAQMMDSTVAAIRQHREEVEEADHQADGTV